VIFVFGGVERRSLAVFDKQRQRDSSRAEQAATGSNSRADQAAAQQSRQRSRQQSGADNSRVEQASEEDLDVCVRERLI
jgi:hypothetical protein